MVSRVEHVGRVEGEAVKVKVEMKNDSRGDVEMFCG